MRRSVTPFTSTVRARFEWHVEPFVLEKGAIECDHRAGQIAACGEKQRPAAAAGGQRPGAVELAPAALERIEKCLGAVEVAERDERLECVGKEEGGDRLAEPGSFDGLGQRAARLLGRFGIANG